MATLDEDGVADFVKEETCRNPRDSPPTDWYFLARGKVKDGHLNILAVSGSDAAGPNAIRFHVKDRCLKPNRDCCRRHLLHFGKLRELNAQVFLDGKEYAVDFRRCDANEPGVFVIGQLAGKRLTQEIEVVNALWKGNGDVVSVKAIGCEADS